MISRRVLKRVIIGLGLSIWIYSCQDSQHEIQEPKKIVSIKETVEEVKEVVDDELMISADSNFTLRLVKTVAVLPSGFDYLYKDSIVMSCVELQRVDTSLMLIAKYITESWSRPEHYLTAKIKSKELFASSSYGLFVFEPTKIKFYFCSDTFKNYKDSTSIIIAYDAPLIGHDMNGNPQIFIEFMIDDFQKLIQNENINMGNYLKADKKWFLSKGIPQGVYREKHEIYTVGN